MSGEFDLHSKKFERRLRILVKLSFRDLDDSNLTGLRPFNNTAVSLS